MRKRDTGQVAAFLTIAALLGGCGTASTAGQSVAATTRTTPKALAPGTAGSFTVTPAVAAIGQTLTYSGRGCPPNAQVQALTPSSGLILPFIKPAPDGSWSATTIVGDESPIGAVTLTAACVVPPSNTAGHYTPVKVRLSTYRHLAVQPSIFVRPGETLTVTAIGSCSISPPGSAMIVSLQATNSSPTAAPPFVPLTLDSSGVWSGPFVVPPSTLPGSYLLNGVCQDRGYYAAFTPLAITVLARNVPMQPTPPAVGHQIPATR